MPVGVFFEEVSGSAEERLPALDIVRDLASGRAGWPGRRARTRRTAMHQSRLMGVIAGLVLGASAVAAAAQTPTVKLTLDFSIQGQQSPFVLAAEGGYFAREGVKCRSIAAMDRR